MNHFTVNSWVNGYVDAWRSPGTAKLATLFTNDVSYRVSPWKKPLSGLEELAAFWEHSRTGPDEKFELQTEIIAVEGRTAVARITVTYLYATVDAAAPVPIITRSNLPLSV